MVARNENLGNNDISCGHMSEGGKATLKEAAWGAASDIGREPAESLRQQ